MYKKVLCFLSVLILSDVYVLAYDWKNDTGVTWASGWKNDTGVTYDTRQVGGRAESRLCANKNEGDSCSPENAPKNSGKCQWNPDQGKKVLSCTAKKCDEDSLLWLTNTRKDNGYEYASQGNCHKRSVKEKECADAKGVRCGLGESYRLMLYKYNGVDGYIGEETCACQRDTRIPSLREENHRILRIVYDCGEGTGEPPRDANSYSPNNSVVVKNNTCQRDGFKFVNWECETETLTAGESFKITENMLCTAQWEELPKPEPEPVIANGGGEPEETLSVVYDCSGGGGATPTDEKKYKSGDTVTTLSNSCEKDGSDFLSWLCGEEQVAAQGTFTITDNTTCSAEWKDDPITRMNSNPKVLPSDDPNLRPSNIPDPELEKKRTKAHNMVSGLSTAATSIGAMEMAQAISEKKADEEAERDMKAYLETMRCNYQKGPEYKYSTEDILLPGGNELLAYYTEYKNLAEEVKAAKTALGMKPGIETEVVYDKAESGLYHYENIGKTGGAYASLSNALLDANSEDAAAWDAEKDKTKKRLIAGATVAGVGAVGGFVGDKLVDKHFDKLENQQISGNTQTQVVTSSYKYEWTEETEEVLERNGITITREEFYEKINDPEFIGTLVGLLGASKGQ